MVVLVVLKVVSRYALKPAMTIIAMTMRAETPREIALFGLANIRQPSNRL